MNNNKEVNHDNTINITNNNSLNNTTNVYTNAICNITSTNDIGQYKEDKESICSNTKKRLSECLYLQQEQQYGRQNRESTPILYNNASIQRRSQILEQRRQRMERKKYQITKQLYKVFYNTDKSQKVSNINIKRYRQAKLLTKQKEEEIKN